MDLKEVYQIAASIDIPHPRYPRRSPPPYLDPLQLDIARLLNSFGGR